MEENNKVISFDEIKTDEAAKEVNVETNAAPVSEDDSVIIEAAADEPVVEEPETKPASEEEPEESAEESLSDISRDQIEQMLQTAEMMVNVMRDQWITTMKEYKVDDNIMTAIAEWNDKHREPMPEGLSEEEQEKWDHLNGVDSLTEEAVTEIFGPAPRTVDGVTFEETVANIKGIAETFLGWMTTLREYRNIHDAYLQLIELEEEESLKELREKAEQEPNPELKQQYLESIDLYYDRKYLGFIADPLEDSVRDALIAARSDGKKIEYWIHRAKEKLQRLKISPNIIMELSQLERRFLGQEYVKNNMLFLLYFLRLAAFCNTDRRDDDGRTKEVCIVMAMDAFIRRVWNEERIGRLMNNLKAFEDQFLPYIPDPKPDESITRPVSDPITGEESKEEVEDAPTEDITKVDDQPTEFVNTEPEVIDENAGWDEPVPEPENEEGNYMLDGISDDFESDEDHNE